MKKLLMSLVMLVIVASGVVIALFNSSRRGYDPGNMPEVLTDNYFENATNIEEIWGFTSKNFSDKDFSNVSLSVLANQSYDLSTKWPEKNKLPIGFHPEEWLEAGRDPGLDVRKLHQTGITGKGVTVAMLDKPINPDHIEYKGRLHYQYVECDSKGKRNKLHFHGASCASVLVGTSCGVAPEAEIYYFAVPDNRKNFYIY